MSVITTNRRNLLLGMGAAAGGTLAGGFAPARAAEATAGGDGAHAADAPPPVTNAAERQPFYGIHQAGIVTPRPANGMVAAFNAVVRTPADLEALFRRLTERIVFLTQGGQPPELDPKLPPADSGILGPMVAPDDLTITVSLGASLFDGRPWLAPHKPRQLQRMSQFPNDALEPAALPRRPVAAVLRQHAGHRHPRAARHREEHVGVPGAALAAGRQRAGRDPAQSRWHAAKRPQFPRLPRRHGQSRFHRGRRHGPPRLGRRRQRRAGVGGWRHLSGGAHHPQFRRALGPHAAAGAAAHHRAPERQRRAARRHPRARRAALRRRPRTAR